MGRRSDYRTPQAIQLLIVEAAERIVTHHGIEKMNARSIAKQMGYAPGTIYVVFRNMQDVKLHVNARTLQKLKAALQNSIASCRKSEICLRNLAYCYFAFALKHSSLWELLFSPHPKAEKIPRWYAAIIEDVFSVVESVLPGYIRTKKARANAARTIWASVHGICTLAITNKLAMADVKSARQLIDLLLNSFLEGCRVQAGRTHA